MKNLETVESKMNEFDFEQIQAGNYATSFLKFMAEKYQESFDGNMRGLIENDGYLSNDEIELVIEKHLNSKEDKESLEESLKAMAQNKFNNLEKLAFYLNFIESIPLLAEGIFAFIQEVKSVKNEQSKGQDSILNSFQEKSSNIQANHLQTFFENAPISKKSLDGLIQTHHQYPQRLVVAIEEQFFPHILVPNEDKQAIFEGVRNYIKTMSEVIQSGAILMDKSKNAFTYLDKTNILENSSGQKIKADSREELSEKIAKKGRGITVYQDHNLMYALIKNFGKNFNQSFKNSQFNGNTKTTETKLDSQEYTLRKEAVNAFVNKLERVIGKQAGIENLKAQKDDISLGKFSDMIKINEVEARYYLVKKGDRYLVSLLPKCSDNTIQQDLNGYVITKTDAENLKINQRIGKQFVGISKNDEADLKDYFAFKSIPNSYINQLKAVLVEQKDVPSTQKKIKMIADKIANTHEGTTSEKQEIKAEIMKLFIPYTGVLDEASGHIISSHLTKNTIPKNYQGINLTQDEQKMILEGNAIQNSRILNTDGVMNYESTLAFNPIKQSFGTVKSEKNQEISIQKNESKIVNNTPKINSERKTVKMSKLPSMKR